MPVNTPNLLARLYPLLGATPTQFNISNKALTTNLATITTSAVHGITQVGTLVTIEGVDTVFDGTYNIHSIPTTSTFTYVKTNDNVTSAAVTPTGIATFNTGASGVTNGFLITNKVVQNGIATLTTSAAHGLAVQDYVSVTIGDPIYDSTQISILSVPTTTTFTYPVSTTTAASTGVTQGSYGRMPEIYTVPAATSTIVTNIIVVNTSTTAATFSMCLNTFCLAFRQTIAASSTAYFDLKQDINATQTINASTSSPRVNIQISGMEVV
jgi:hypothetical protein